MEYLGLFIEFLFLAMGIYLYLFSIGRLKSGDEKAQKRAEEFRRRNAGWLRVASLLLIALMVVNIYLHIAQLFQGQ
ncbi:MAG: hypothetical protein J5I94_04630 [Phaeodactylibacter sp.]|nr:hypothetical protein [Phaeodactylibacter sp.]